MTERARAEYASVLRLRYERATKPQRSALLDEYCRTTGCHRKAAIRALRRMPGASTRPPGRPRRYHLELQPLLERIWIASYCLSGKLLAAVLPVLLTALEQHPITLAREIQQTLDLLWKLADSRPTSRVATRG